MSVDYAQYVGSPFQIISHLGVRYTGIFQLIDQNEQVIHLNRVFSWGTEDRPAAHYRPPNPETLGWVKFKTDAIQSLSVPPNYREPGQQQAMNDDPALASVSHQRPAGVPASEQPYSPPYQQQPLRQPPGLAAPEQQGAPSRPPAVQHRSSVDTVMDRVQQQLATMSSQPKPKSAKPVPQTDYDFSANQKIEEERLAQRRRPSHTEGGDGVAPEEGGNSENGEEAGPSTTAKSPPAPTYQKSSFFDNLSHQTGKTNRNEERHRNLDTFGQAGGGYDPGHVHRGGRGGRGGGFGQRGRGGGRGNHNGGGAWRGGSNGFAQPAWS